MSKGFVCVATDAVTGCLVTGVLVDPPTLAMLTFSLGRVGGPIGGKPGLPSLLSLRTLSVDEIVRVTGSGFNGGGFRFFVTLALEAVFMVLTLEAVVIILTLEAVVIILTLEAVTFTLVS